MIKSNEIFDQNETETQIYNVFLTIKEHNNDIKYSTILVEQELKQLQDTLNQLLDLKRSFNLQQTYNMYVEINILLNKIKNGD